MSDKIKLKTIKKYNMSEGGNSAEDFLTLIKNSRRGKFKVYIGMSAGVGKTYRMLQEAHALLENGIDVKIGYIETHNRKETHALLEGLSIIPRRKLFYKGKELEELDVQAVLNLRPEVVIVDELAHTNIEGSKNEKRWQDVMEILDSGINVISAVNIQHIESLNEEVKSITDIEVKERIPDSMLSQADEVVNIDLTAEELINRLKAGKIYDQAKINSALNNFFKSESILQLRELALKEVASQVTRKVESEVTIHKAIKKERFLACISSNEKTAKNVIRKTARLANYYNSQWYLLYVQIPRESSDKIALDKQRHLINNFKLATELGAEIIKVENPNVAHTIMEQCEERKITTVCIGKPHLNLWKIILATDTFNSLLNKLSQENIDLVILS
ncbi:sensor protein KdpD [Chryseobacterium camelliae]|uniref:Sensor protein KdpD n=2 Tax=Chryseobacterium camelliae TaxID=1265445 RepID=A0ABY7QM09_9FLAO|nr:sensor protein KdpD [Chryseobacterium camelliae]WBV60667.1 sensor protein KdpD [Chryseobacterium camelliae]